MALPNYLHDNGNCKSNFENEQKFPISAICYNFDIIVFGKLMQFLQMSPLTVLKWVLLWNFEYCFLIYKVDTKLRM